MCFSFFPVHSARSVTQPTRSQLGPLYTLYTHAALTRPSNIPWAPGPQNNELISGTRVLVRRRQKKDKKTQRSMEKYDLYHPDKWWLVWWLDIATRFRFGCATFVCVCWFLFFIFCSRLEIFRFISSTYILVLRGFSLSFCRFLLACLLVENSDGRKICKRLGFLMCSNCPRVKECFA